MTWNEPQFKRACTLQYLNKQPTPYLYLFSQSTVHNFKCYLSSKKGTMTWPEIRKIRPVLLKPSSKAPTAAAWCQSHEMGLGITEKMRLFVQLLLTNCRNIPSLQIILLTVCWSSLCSQCSLNNYSHCTWNKLSEIMSVKPLCEWWNKMNAV